jgi:hypothetical protein
MRDKYWAMYCEFVDSKFYYWHYRDCATCKNNIINTFLCIASFSGIASWLIWKQISWVWAIIVGVSQVASAIRGLLPYSNQISSISLFIPEIDLLINEVDHDWYSVDRNKLDDDEINNLIFDYKKRFSLLEHKYINNTNFSRIKCCENKAIKDRELYFFQHYDIEDIKTFKKKEVEMADVQ